MSILFILAGIGQLIMAVRCQLDDNQLRNRFISKNGTALSLLALPYVANLEAGRQQVVADRWLRRAFLVEMYLGTALLFWGGIWLLIG